MKDPFFTYGPPDLRCWKTSPRVFSIQCRNPAFARKLRKRQDVCELGTVGINCYLRQFAVPGDWRKLRRLIARYLTSAGDRISGAASTQEASEIRNSIRRAGALHGALKTEALR